MHLSICTILVFYSADDTEDLKSRWPNWEMFVKRILVFLKTGRHEDELTRPEQKAIQKAAKTYYLEGNWSLMVFYWVATVI